MTSFANLHRPEGCPDLEEIAAFIDKTLGPQERQRLMRHFVQCRDCYEIFAGASRFYLDSLEEGKVVPFSRKKAVLQTGLAAAAVLAVAVGVRSYRASLEPPISATAQLVSPGVARTATDFWDGPRDRGRGEGEKEGAEREFSFGVQVVNLQAGLIAGNRERSEDAIIQIHRLLGQELAVDAIQKSYSDLRAALWNPRTVPQEMLPAATQAGAALGERLDSPYFELGRWAAAGFISASARDPHFFDSREAQRFPGWLLRHQKRQEDLPENEQVEIAPEVLDEVRAIEQILEERDSLEEEEYDQLKSHLSEVLYFYYPYYREETP